MAPPLTEQEQKPWVLEAYINGRWDSLRRCKDINSCRRQAKLHRDKYGKTEMKASMHHDGRTTTLVLHAD
jgi:hypothetical protein